MGTSQSAPASGNTQSRLNVNTSKAEVKKWIEALEEQGSTTLCGIALHEAHSGRHDFIILYTDTGARFRIDHHPKTVAGLPGPAEDIISSLDFVEYQHALRTSDVILSFEWKEEVRHQVIDLRMALTVMLAISACTPVPDTSSWRCYAETFMATCLRFFIGCSVRVDSWESPPLLVGPCIPSHLWCLGKDWEDYVSRSWSEGWRQGTFDGEMTKLPRDCQSAINLAVKSRVIPWMYGEGTEIWRLEFWTAVSPIIGSCWRLENDDQDHKPDLCPAVVFVAKILCEQLAMVFQREGVYDLYKTLQASLKDDFHQLFNNEFSTTIMDIAYEAQKVILPSTIWTAEKSIHEVQGPTGCFTGKTVTVQPVFLLQKRAGFFPHDPEQTLSFEAVRNWMVKGKKTEMAEKIALGWDELSFSCWPEERSEKSRQERFRRYMVNIERSTSRPQA
ncbi:hypothetical protein DL96DRAFT_1704407 [Flagelloscypha sp. PMI_526]|nr:hypothetical protein DL96DRAFT_1704407 [Flagelloscypha sp. PMI_526]